MGSITVTVVATRSDLPPPTIEIMDVDLSDHPLLQWTVPTTRLSLSYASFVERRLEIAGH